MQVYDPQEQRYRHLNKLPTELEHLSPLASSTAPADASHPPSPSTSSASSTTSSLLDPSLSLTSRLSAESKHNARLTSLDFLGLPPPPHLTQQLVTGKLNPKTLQPYATDEPSVHSFFMERARPEGKEEPRMRGGGGRVELVTGRWGEEDGGCVKAIDQRRVMAELDDMLGAGSWQRATTPLQGVEEASVASVGSDGVGSAGVERERGKERGDVKAKARAKPKTKVEMDRERRDREEKRSTGGGLRRFFSAGTAPG